MILLKWYRIRLMGPRHGSKDSECCKTVFTAVYKLVQISDVLEMTDIMVPTTSSQFDATWTTNGCNLENWNKKHRRHQSEPTQRQHSYEIFNSVFPYTQKSCILSSPDLEQDLNGLRTWLHDVESRLLPLCVRPHWNTAELEAKLKEHQVSNSILLHPM